MPRGDGMGPDGMGASSGRGGGFYVGFGNPGNMNTLPIKNLSNTTGEGRSREWLNMASQLIPAALYLVYLIATRDKKDKNQD